MSFVAEIQVSLAQEWFKLLALFWYSVNNDATGCCLDNKVWCDNLSRTHYMTGPVKMDQVST